MKRQVILSARIALAAEDEFEARELLQKLFQSESNIEMASVFNEGHVHGSVEYGGRDLTFPDGSEGGYWVEPQGYTVKVDVPNRGMLELVIEALHNMRNRAPHRRVRRTGPRRAYVAPGVYTEPK